MKRSTFLASISALILAPFGVKGKTTEGTTGYLSYRGRMIKAIKGKVFLPNGWGFDPNDRDSIEYH